MPKSLILSFFVFCSIELISQNYTQKIIPDDPRTGVFFGRYLDLNDNTAFISAYLDYENGTSSGSLYVFDLNFNKFGQTSKLFPDDGAVEDYFSYSVSSYGNYLITGAHHDSDLGASSGSAYILKKNEGKWDFFQKIVPSDGKEADEFGNTVAMYEDNAVSCAYLDDDKGTNSGSIYTLKLVNNNWEIISKIYASDPEPQSLFGLTLDLYKNYLIIGAPFYNGTKNDIGKAYIFEYNGNEWKEIAALLPDELDDLDQFGSTVKITDEYAFVSAIKDDDKGDNSGAVYIYARNFEQKWKLSQKISAPDGSQGDGFGIALEANDTVLFVGSYFDDDNGTNSGSVYLYKKEGAFWVYSKKITPSDGDESDAFGSCLAFNEHGLLVGAYSDDDNGFFSGAVYYFSLKDLNTVSLKSVRVADDIRVYPTLTEEFVTLENNLWIGDLEFDIFSLNGTKVFSGIFRGQKETIDISGLVEGLYILKVQSSEFCMFFKFIRV
ncbi:MAG: T9SS type A sorting domain-containing protein [Saprospiraceae bacterium]|nr:T9SS type A sorting domain-containing protein [Saprospiraceae bacterium]